MFRRQHLLLLPMIVLLAATVACGTKKVEKAPRPAGVSASALGITIASVPQELTVQSSAPDRIVLTPADHKLGGTIEITGAPKEADLNLQEAVKRHQKEIEGRPGGRYLGAQELTGPTGTAYWSRGRYTTDGTEVEETRIVTLDPAQQRIIRLTYVYPAGQDSRNRVKTLLDVTAEIERYKAPAR